MYMCVFIANEGKLAEQDLTLWFSSTFPFLCYICVKFKYFWQKSATDCLWFHWLKTTPWNLNKWKVWTSPHLPTFNSNHRPDWFSFDNYDGSFYTLWKGQTTLPLHTVAVLGKNMQSRPGFKPQILVYHAEALPIKLLTLPDMRTATFFKTVSILWRMCVINCSPSLDKHPSQCFAQRIPMVIHPGWVSNIAVLGGNVTPRPGFQPWTPLLTVLILYQLSYRGQLIWEHYNNKIQRWRASSWAVAQTFNLKIGRLLWNSYLYIFYSHIYTAILIACIREVFYSIG